MSSEQYPQLKWKKDIYMIVDGDGIRWQVEHNILPNATYTVCDPVTVTTYTVFVDEDYNVELLNTVRQ